MQIDLKAALILLGTLALGVVLGAVGEGMLARARSARVVELRQPRGFVAHIEDAIHPRDAAQRDAIIPIITATAAANDSILRSAHEGFHAALDSMKARLNPLLDNAQRARLAEEGQRPAPIDGPGDGRGPPPDGRGPPPDDRGMRGPPPDGRGPPRPMSP